jgi:hypothetical protein
VSEAAASTTPPADPPATDKSKVKTTEYLVLYAHEGSWFEGPVVKARSPRKAIEATLDRLPKSEETEVSKFVAIPKRYWVVEEPGVETQTKIVFK